MNLHLSFYLSDFIMLEHQLLKISMPQSVYVNVISLTVFFFFFFTWSLLSCLCELLSIYCDLFAFYLVFFLAFYLYVWPNCSFIWSPLVFFVSVICLIYFLFYFDRHSLSSRCFVVLFVFCVNGCFYYLLCLQLECCFFLWFFLASFCVLVFCSMSVIAFVVLACSLLTCLIIPFWPHSLLFGVPL